MRFDLLVVLSEAETSKIPWASMSKVTSIRGTPRGAGDTREIELTEQVVAVETYAYISQPH
jgi:hypothetical protein